MSEETSLIDMFDTHEGHRIHKYPHVIEEYDYFFQSRRNQPVCIVEVGIADGGSLELWRKYFGQEARIVGVDIADRLSLAKDLDVDIISGDQGDKRFWDWFKLTYPPVDIFIDDGSHNSQDQITTFESMFPHVAQNGLYCCEDLHTSYHPQFGGGYLNEHSFIEFLKGKIDSLHASASVNEELHPDAFTETAYGIHVFPTLAIVEKRPAASYGGPVMRGNIY